MLEAMPPMGKFYTPLDPAAEKHYLGFAGGSGITPVLSIVKTVLAREPKSRFTLVYANRQISSIMFREELEDLKNTLPRPPLGHPRAREPRRRRSTSSPAASTPRR